MSDFVLKKEYLDNIFQRRVEKIKWLRDGKGIVKHVESGFKFYDQNIAIHHLCNQNTEEEYRRMFFNSGLMWHYINVKYNNDQKGYWFPTNQVCYLIFSDNDLLINLVNQSSSFPFNGEYIGNYFSRMILSIATNNWNSLSDTFDIYMNTFENSGSWYAEKDIYTKIFRAFIDRNTVQLNSNLNLLQTSKFKNSRIKQDNTEKYFSCYTSAFVKLALNCGLSVELISELVPENLLPDQPLEEYTIPYMFLRDWCREQNLDWRYEPVHPELQDWDNDKENPNRNNGGFLSKLFS